MDYQILASDDKYSELIFEMHSQCEPTLTTRFSSDNQASGDELYVVIFSKVIWNQDAHRWMSKLVLS